MQKLRGSVLIRIFRRHGKTHTCQRPYPGVWHGLLFLTLILALLGSFTLLNLLDPYSIFGRLAADPFKALVLWINNMVANILEHYDIYALTIKKQHHIPLSVLTISIGSFVILLFFSAVSGRGYCNTICPVGAFLGMLSRVSFFKFVIDREKCRSCRLCEKVCKAGCIDNDTLEIDSSRCVACFNCTNACPHQAIAYTPAFPISSQAPSRRRFLITTAAAGGTLLSSALYSHLRSPESQPPGQTPVMPPGAKSRSTFLQRCTACHLCVSVCPTNVLRPAGSEYGVWGMMQPKLDYGQGHCDFDCSACGQVCPTGAIAPLLLPEKKLTRIGTVSLNKHQCIVHVKKKHCGACGEVCPTHAIFPVKKGLVLFPEINTDYCIGCGACERACPTKPKAITIRAEIVHTKAKKYLPPASALPQPAPQSSGFPF